MAKQGSAKAGGKPERANRTLHLTAAAVERLRTDRPGGVRYSDSRLENFGLYVSPPSRRRPNGRKSFWVAYVKEGKQKRMKIGTYPDMSPETAREKAGEVLGQVRGGADPVEERKPAITFTKWVEQYLDGVRRRKKQPGPDERFLAGAVERWGKRPIDHVARDEVAAAMRDVERNARHRHEERLQGAREALAKAKGRKKRSPSLESRLEARIARLESTQHPGRVTANRWLAAVRACLAEAKRSGHLVVNVAGDVRPYRENPPRARVLTDEELRRLLEAIAKEPDAHVRAAFRLLIETGARTSEVMRARWEDFDLAEATWRIPSPKAGRPQLLPLPSRTVGMLRRLERNGPWLVPGLTMGQPRYDLRRPWQRIREAAALPPDLHIHDIRRTFGLHVARTAGLHVASKLLRHADVRVTERVYAPLDLATLRKALEKHGEVVPFNEANGGKES